MRVMVSDPYADALIALKLAGAFVSKYDYTDERTSRAEEIPVYANNPARLQTEWYGNGKNHRTENGHAKRELEHEAWFVVANTPERLHELATLTGAVLAVVESPEPIFKLEIEGAS